MDGDNLNNYIFDMLKKIEEKQDCKSHNKNYCELELGMTQCMYNTIPLMFTCRNNCEWYISSGIFEDPITRDFKCFKTPVFRVAKVNEEKKIVILELLQLQSSNGEIAQIYCKREICDFFSSVPINKFIRTGIYININIDSFGGIECLQPVYARRGIPKGNTNEPHVLDVETTEYVAISDGVKRIYLNNDGIEGFNVIPDPLTISYSNLFVNAMLQPPISYTVTKGKLTLNTQDIPIAGTYIILQSIRINKHR